MLWISFWSWSFLWVVCPSSNSTDETEGVDVGGGGGAERGSTRPLRSPRPWAVRWQSPQSSMPNPIEKVNQSLYQHTWLR